MNSESGQKLSLEELKGRNLPLQSAPMLPAHPTQQEWSELLARLERLEASVGAQEAPLRALSQRVGQLPTQAQLEALAREAAKLRTEVRRAGRKKELSISPPGLDTALSVLAWLVLLLLGTMVGMVVLRTIWSGLAAVWSAVKVLIP
jgi:uncharacterized coiled-coil protein SlyX